MNKNLKYISIIPARGGSKGVPGKNTRTLAGKPLIAWSIESSLSCGLISKTIVSTDDLCIADIAKRYGAEVPFMRPHELAKDETATEPVLKHTLEWLQNNGYSVNAFILMQPTSPFRKKNTISDAIKKFETQNLNSLLSVCKNNHFFWKNVNKPQSLYDYRNRPRRQDIQEDERWYKETGSIYITRADAFMRQGNRLCEPIGIYVMDDEEGYEIDTVTDFCILESIMSKSNLYDN